MLEDYEEDNPAPPVSPDVLRRTAWSVLVCSSVLLVASLALFRLSPSQAPLVVPVALAFAAAGLTLLSLRARERAARDDPSG